MLNNIKRINVNDTFIKTLSFVSFFFTILYLIEIFKTSPSSGYELSIYSAYSSFFWFLFMLSIIVSIGTIILSALFNSKSWIYSLFNLLISYAILFFLPTIRGYSYFSLGNSDLFFHLREIDIILASSHLAPSLLYPMIHLLSASIYLITDIPIALLTVTICFFFFMIYLLSFYLLGLVILGTKQGSLLMLTLASPLMFQYLHYSFVPYMFGLSLLPLIIYCFIEGSVLKRIDFRILTIILVICVVFFHPLITIIVLVIFGIYEMFYIKKDPYLALTNILILTVSFFTWYFNFKPFLKKISLILTNLFTSEKSTTILDYQMSSIESSDASLLLIIERYIKMYGSPSLYILMAILCIIFILKKYSIKQARDIEIIFSLQFICAMLFAFLQFIYYLVIFEPSRAISFPTVISPILSGIVIHESFKNIMSVNKKRLIAITMFIIICLSCSLGIFNLYESPWKGTPSKHMTHMEIDGRNWYLQYTNASIPLMIKYSSFKKYAFYKSTLYDYQIIIDENNSIPSHFGYDNYENIAQYFDNEQRYLIIDALHRQGILAVDVNRRQRLDQYSEEDFQKLSNDPTIVKIYINNEYEIWKTSKI